MRVFYNILFYCILPFLMLRLFCRSFRQPDYRKRINERFGFYPCKFEKSIWVHAVSVGETLAAIPLIKSLKEKYPNIPVIVTTMTPTGAQRIQTAFGDKITHLYIPYDFSGAVKRFLNNINPIIAIIMETELWPNLLYFTTVKKIPICLVNARLSEKSAKSYAKIPEITRQMLNQITIIAAHGVLDAQRFIELGAPAERVFVTGNIKFDIDIPQAVREKGESLRSEFGKERFVWIGASTHEGEEEILLAAHQQLLTKDKNALLVLVPRHPNRFDAIAKMSAQKLKVCRRSKQEICQAETQVYLGDTMGELVMLYSASDVAFVGGSLIPRGGHNILEAAALAKPLLTGNSLYNFAEISDKFLNADALIKVKDSKQLAEELTLLMQNDTRCREVGDRALQVVTANRGALAKQVGLIEKTLQNDRSF